MNILNMLAFTLTQSSLFFVMMLLGWIIYLLIDLGAMNKATPGIQLGEVVNMYLRINAFEIMVSFILLIALSIMQSYNELQKFIEILGLTFSNKEDTPLGFAFILGMNVKVLSVAVRKVNTPINLNESHLKEKSMVGKGKKKNHNKVRGRK